LILPEEDAMTSQSSSYAALEADLRARGIAADDVRAAIRALKIETPSWGYAQSGTRFKVFKHPAAARTIQEKLDDAGLVHRLTGACPTVAVHIPWDKTDDWAGVAKYAAERGLALGAVNPNLFQDSEYMLGSLCHADAAVRKQAMTHMYDCLEIAQTIGSPAISLWLADGTNYPGQDNIRERRQRLLDCLREYVAKMPDGMTLLIEYKLFEPAFYHTDLADWGAAFSMAGILGPKAKVLVDTGHHAPGTNIEYIVAWLLALDKLGGFHFNCRNYADDDLIVGSSQPFQLFAIFHELINGGKAGRAAETAYMLDQSHSIENKIEAVLQSVQNVQLAYAKALCVDRKALTEAQQAGDVLGAHRILMAGYETDVRPLLASIREEDGLPVDPFQAFRESGVAERLAAERGGSNK
jgi:L-rhamnose isomerase/sugar isomerase